MTEDMIIAEVTCLKLAVAPSLRLKKGLKNIYIYMYVRQSHTDTHGKVLTKPYCRCGENIYTTSLCEFSWNQNWSHVTMNRWILFVSGRRGEREILA